MTKRYKTFVISKKNNFTYYNIDQIEINPLYSGFQYGKGVFTTAKFLNNKIEFYFEHVSRLLYSCLYYDIYFDAEFSSIIMDEIQKLVIQVENSYDEADNTSFFANKSNEMKIKIIVSFISQTESYITIIAEPYRNELKHVNLIVNPVIRGNEEIYRHKTCNYMTIDHDMQMLRKQNLLQQKTNFNTATYTNSNIYTSSNSKINTNTKSINKADILFGQWLYFNSENKIVEASYSNIFFIKDDSIFTPDKSMPLLSGIIRNKIVAIKSFTLQSTISKSSIVKSDKQRLTTPKVNKYRINEAIIDYNEIKNYDAAFITNALIGCVPVVLIGCMGELISYNVGIASSIIYEIKALIYE